MFDGVPNASLNITKYLKPYKLHNLFHDGGPYHIESSPLICYASQWTGFNMLGTSVMKELNLFLLEIVKFLKHYVRPPFLKDFYHKAV